ncbi:MAG: twin-arginine translocase TatA/TatE family subunit [Ktedonobacterales bacterium]
MLGFGHLPEILLICLVALIVLGPKRMIEMGSALGKAVRELREATKDLNLSSLLESSGPSKPTSASLGAFSQFTQSLSNSIREMSQPDATSPTLMPPAGPATVESQPLAADQPGERSVTETDVLPN